MKRQLLISDNPPTQTHMERWPEKIAFAVVSILISAFCGYLVLSALRKIYGAD